MPTYTGINHLAMATGDIETTIRFWRDLLGMPMVAGIGQKDFQIYFFEAGADMIGFFYWPEAEPIPEKDHGFPVKGPVAFDHVSIGVDGRDELWDLKDRLDAAGFWVSEVMDLGFILSLYSFDPNGIAIEFSWPKPGVDLHKTPALVGDKPAAVALEGSEPKSGHWPRPTKPTAPEDKVTYPGEGGEFGDPNANQWQK